MATAKGKWFLDDLDKAMQKINEHGLSTRKMVFPEVPFMIMLLENRTCATWSKLCIDRRRRE